MRFGLVAAALLALAACGERAGERASHGPAQEFAGSQAAEMDRIAEEFVRLALAVDRHDPGYVDAYHGPEEWAQAAQAEERSVDDVIAQAERLQAELRATAGDARARLLDRQLTAALTRLRMARGEQFAFDDETRLIYDAVAPAYALAAFDAVLAEVDALLPGEGPLNERVDAFRNSLAIPADRLEAVFTEAIAECRRRTLEHIALPDSERFTLEFVTDKPWSGYNWYKGDYVSLIQINTDLPIVIDRAVDLGCHEGYPGHHAWNVLLERDLLKGEGWREYLVLPLFSPKGVISEGTGNHGVDVAFPGEEKIAYERDVLFPLAGLDPEDAPKLEALNALRRKLAHAEIHIAREYLDGRISREEAIELFMRYSLASRARAEQRVRFVETYRGYIINYSLGRDLVRAHIDAEIAGGAEPWAAFKDLLTNPVSASDLTRSGQ